VPLATFKAWLPQHKGFQFLPTSSSIEEMLLWVFGGPVRATLTSIGLVMFGAWVGLHAYWRTKLRAKHHIQGSVFSDVCVHLWCHCFAVAQEAVEADTRELGQIAPLTLRPWPEDMGRLDIPSAVQLPPF